jgi:Tfp pilus assembly protein PilF
LIIETRSISRTSPLARRFFTRLALVGLFAGAFATGCRKAKTASVEDLYATRTLGLGYLQRNQLPEAEAEFKKLTTMAPDDALGYADLGIVYLQSGRLADAEKQLQRARELDSTSAEVGLALARVYALTNRAADARTTLEKLRSGATPNAHVLYALARMASQQHDASASAAYEARLRDVLALAPANLATRVDLLNAFVTRGAADSAVRQLEEIRRIPPELPTEVRAALDSTITVLRAGDLAAARVRVDRLSSRMRVTAPYQASLADVNWIEGPIPGRPVLSFAPRDFITLHGLRGKASVDVAKFVDATAEAGFVAGDPKGAPVGDAAPFALATGDFDGDGTDDLFVSSWSAATGKAAVRLYRVQRGFLQDVTERSKVVLPQGAVFASFADFDNDGWLDLFVIGAEGRGHLFRNNGNGTFADVSGKAGIGDVRGARKGVFVDLDHDGDLDLLLIGAGQQTVYRNNLDGTFTEGSAAMGLAGGAASDVVFGDFDGDGRTDLFVASERGKSTLLHNGGPQHFRDVTSSSGLASVGGSSAVAAADFNNDGYLDLFVAGANGGESSLWLNKGDGTFVRDHRSDAALKAARSVTSAAFVDYDNDGWLDLVVTSRSSVLLLRNDGAGRYLDRSTQIPDAVRKSGGAALSVADIDDDGDEDLLFTDASGAPRVLKNEMGNSNLGVNVELKGLGAGSGKNNAFGIGARLELRAGDIYQTRVATGRRTHFGLGPHLKADVLNIEWPNGLPQTVYLPGSDQDVVEREALKGSCAFAYTWDGKRFRFVTDAMWRSALGMPLGLMGSNTAFAPAGASQEYIRIPGDAFAPRDGRYVLQLTEELWETAYADKLELLAVDHPDSVDVFVDETFVPPGPVKLRMYQVARREIPLSAVDERGTDLLAALRTSDSVYVSNFTPTHYQGVVNEHDLILDLGPNAGNPETYLFLRGWIYPTDASINIALSQQKAIKLASPSFEVRDATGAWHMVTPNLGFPSGKDKTMIIDLAGKFPTADHHVRIRTNLQIYWDEAFTAKDVSASTSKLTTLAPISANLHERGFSRTYRKGGRYGPYWFAYDDLTKESPWRPIAGAFTRFGDVLPLLRDPDDMYVVMAPGDETTIEFDASSANTLPRGWKRDFLLYTDGWIKDSDLNTAFGTTVGPLPYHGVKSYPYAAGDSYPTDAAHLSYLKEYDTRTVKANERHR